MSLKILELRVQKSMDGSQGMRISTTTGQGPDGRGLCIHEGLHFAFWTVRSHRFVLSMGNVIC